MVNPLDFLLPCPCFHPSKKQRAEFDATLDSTYPGSFVDYQLSAPKWQFLSYLCKSRNLVLHGSQNQDIEKVEPRKALDTKAFSAQDAIYATTDGIWAIYFAIIDRVNFGPLSLFNSCLYIRFLPKLTKGPLYFFSVTHSALVNRPWCNGAIYILPRETFEQEPEQSIMGATINFPHWISPESVKPVAKLLVTPHDFPYLSQIHGHDDEKLKQLTIADPNGFPWPGALVE